MTSKKPNESLTLDRWLRFRGDLDTVHTWLRNNRRPTNTASTLSASEECQVVSERVSVVFGGGLVRTALKCAPSQIVCMPVCET